MRTKRIGAFAAVLLTANMFAFDVATSVEQVPESNPVIRCHVRANAGRFSFVRPTGWSHAVNAAEQILVLRNNDSGMITIKFTDTVPPSPDGLGSSVTKSRPGAEVVETYIAPSGGKPGFGIEFKENLSGVVFTGRIHSYPIEKKSVEVALLARYGADPAIHQAWTILVNTFRVESP